MNPRNWIIAALTFISTLAVGWNGMTQDQDRDRRELRETLSQLSAPTAIERANAYAKLVDWPGDWSKELRNEYLDSGVGTRHLIFDLAAERKDSVLVDLALPLVQERDLNLHLPARLYLRAIPYDAKLLEGESARIWKAYTQLSRITGDFWELIKRDLDFYEPIESILNPLETSKNADLFNYFLRLPETDYRKTFSGLCSSGETEIAVRTLLDIADLPADVQDTVKQFYSEDTASHDPEHPSMKIYVQRVRLNRLLPLTNVDVPALSETRARTDGFGGQIDQYGDLKMGHPRENTATFFHQIRALAIHGLMSCPVVPALQEDIHRLVRNFREHLYDFPSDRLHQRIFRRYLPDYSYQFADGRDYDSRLVDLSLRLALLEIRYGGSDAFLREILSAASVQKQETVLSYTYRLRTLASALRYEAVRDQQPSEAILSALLTVTTQYDEVFRGEVTRLESLGKKITVSEKDLLQSLRTRLPSVELQWAMLHSIRGELDQALVRLKKMFQIDPIVGGIPLAGDFELLERNPDLEGVTRTEAYFAWKTAALGQ